MPVPYTFGTATAAIPLSQLDSNFATAITLGNTAVYLGNTTTTLGNVTLTNVTISSGNVTLTGANVSGTANVSTLVVTGNQTFVGTGNRITGDFSNATITNRVAFQSSTANGNTGVFFIPNGTAVNANIQVANNSDPTNCSLSQLVVNSTESSFRASISGTGTYLPMTFWTNGSERVRIDTSGNVGIGATAGTILDVYKASGNPYFRVYTGTGSVQGYMQALDSTYVKMGALSSHDLGLVTGGTEAVRITTGGNVGIGTSSPNASAILDAQSTTKGVRMPNMTTTQKNAISSPAAGLMVFDTTLAKLCVYSGSAWQTITSV